jgi:YidC/Oxa1 family membrane protein insertase
MASTVIAVAQTRSTDDCILSIEFGDDGSIAQWQICAAGVAQDIVSPTRQELDVTVRFDDQSDAQSLVWDARPSAPGGKSEGRTIIGDGLEIRRIAKLVAENQIDYEISVINRSVRPARLLELNIDLGGARPATPEGKKSLAEHLYSIDRAMFREDDLHWSSGQAHQFASTVALQTRFVVFVADSSKIARFVPSPSSSSANRNRSWQISYRIEEIDPGGEWSVEQTLYALPTESAELRTSGFDRLLYSDLWSPIAALSRIIESLVAKIGRMIGSSGGAIIVIAILIRFATLPFTYWAYGEQIRFKHTQAQMKPQLDEIRQQYRGAEQSERILQLYKQFSITPFSGLKGSVGLFIQIPFLLAFFHVTTASALFAQKEFLWITDLSISDSFATLPVFIPIIGDEFNLLPLALAAVNAVSISKEAAQSGRSPIGMSLFTLFIVLIFYSFCAALVLYWVVVNIAQLVERVVFEKLEYLRPGGVKA